MQMVQGLEEALNELDRAAPGVPLLALGQTVFWDEPMKAGAALAASRRPVPRLFIGGIHDTDYFAKVPGAIDEPGREPRFLSLPHNDTSTKEIWSAAAEFSALFGSETVVRREDLSAGGLKIHRLEQVKPGFMESLTEAWGWRGLAMSGNSSIVAADVPAQAILPELVKTLQWAVSESIASLEGEAKKSGLEQAEALTELLCRHADSQWCRSLSDLYESLLPELHSFAAGEKVPIETTKTSRLLQFNRETSSLPRFRLLDIFISPAYRDKAVSSYNEVVRSSGLYELDRFGTCALPFEVYIPKIGRGTLRLGRRGAVILTPQPQFLSFKREPQSAADLAAALEDKFGPNCSVVGKAVTLIGMLASEFCFVFHEGASSYVQHSRKMHSMMNKFLEEPLKLNPILRIKYSTWDSLEGENAELSLPEPLRGPFGTQKLGANQFGKSWRQVSQNQKELISQLGQIRSPLLLIDFLEKLSKASSGTVGEDSAFWNQRAVEYRSIQKELAKLKRAIDEKTAVRKEFYTRISELKKRRSSLEQAKGKHFREHIFEKSPSSSRLAERAQFSQFIENASDELQQARISLRQAAREQGELANGDAAAQAHQRRREIEWYAESARGRLLREAVTASQGLEHASLRPSSWWFPLVSPSGSWFKRTIEAASCYLEPLS